MSSAPIAQTAIAGEATTPAATVTAIILAAGKGTRMRSARSKLIHPVAGWPMIRHVIAAVREAGATRAAVVLGHEAEAVRVVLPFDELSMSTVVQEPQLGTGHAVRVALDALSLPPPVDEVGGPGVALILYGDMPLISATTLRALLDLHRRGDYPLSLISAVVANPYGYGRILRDADGRVVGVKEQKELTPDEEGIAEINCGVYCADLDWLRRGVRALPRHPDGEYYLPDLVPRAVDSGGVGVLGDADAAEMQGVNDRAQLADADALMRARINRRHMLAGVTIVDPARTYIEPLVRIGADTVIHPNTHLRGDTVIGGDCAVGPDSEIADSTLLDGATVARSVVEGGARVGRGCHVGPYAHLRQGAVLEEGAQIGNYAEVKNAVIGPGAVAHHVSYLGDATVGEGTNIGAGTIIANYDGVNKHRTTIGARVFVGSNTVLRAPVTLGDDSRTGAGAVVLRDVAPGRTVAGVPAREITPHPPLPHAGPHPWLTGPPDPNRGSAGPAHSPSQGEGEQNAPAPLAARREEGLNMPTPPLPRAGEGAGG